MLTQFKNWANSLKQYVKALYFASRSEQVPLLAKILIVMVVAYAVSPIDLIPDFIPVLGYLDDLLLLPLAIYIVIKLVPRPIWQECLKKAQQPLELPTNKTAGRVIIGLWIILFISVIFWFSHHP